MVFTLAIKNIFRRKSRTLIVIFMISFALAGLLNLQGIYDGMLKQMIDNTIRSGIGHLVIEHKEYKINKKLKDKIDNKDEILNLLSEYKEIKALSLKLKNDGLIASAKSSQGVIIIGIEPKSEEKFGKLSSFLIDGEYELNNKDVIVGADLAKKLNLKIGSKVVVTTQNLNNQIVSELFRVKGILRANNPSIDKYAIYINLNKADTFFEAKGSVTQITMMLNSNAKIFKEEITPQLDRSLIAYSWQEYYPLFEISNEMMDIFNAISYTVVFLIVALGIFDILLISVLERMREFGIMIAIGTTKVQVMGLIILESFIIGLLGFIFGAIFGGGLLLYFHIYGLDLSFAKEGLESFGIAKVIYADFELKFFIYAFTSIFIATFFASLIPIRMIYKLKPIEAIRFV